MNGKQRIQKALNREQPDVVPIWEMAFNEESIIGIGKYFVDEDKLPPKKKTVDMSQKEKAAMMNTYVTFVNELDLDGVTALSTAPRERIDKDHIRDAYGIVYHQGGEKVGEPYPVDGPIKSMSDFKKYKMRSSEDGDFAMLDLFRSVFPDRSVALHMPATFKLSWSLMGSMEEFLVKYLLEPEHAHRLARLATDYCFEVVENAVKKGVDWIIMEGDLAYNPGPLMSPAHYDEFIGPYHKEICDKAHACGVKIVKHSDGNLTPLIPALLNAGFDGIHPIQPQCMDIYETKKTFSDRACILGNIDCSFLLVFDSPEETRQSVKETIAAAAPGGGYILSSSNTIHPGCKPENYLAMVEAARKYGKYPELAGI